MSGSSSSNEKKRKRSGSTKDERILIFDTTLRDGEQTPGVSLTPENKLQIAKQLDRLGVDIIEAGFPITSKGEIEAMKSIAKAGLNAEICGLARTSRKDIDAALECGVDSIHTFIATSDIHLKHKLKMTREQALEKAIDAVEYCKSHGVTVEFSAEDATRTDPSYLKKVFGAVCDAGANRIDIPDTVGVITPDKMFQLVTDVKTVVDVPISLHCHNDFGLAVANTLAGINAGARTAHVAVNGLGERAGNASLEELVMALYCLQRRKTGIHTELIYETSRLVSRIAGIVIQPNKAIVGENAFGHESGIHTHGVLEMPLTYEPMAPELVGRKRWIQAGKHAGGHGIDAQLKELGIDVNQNQLKEIVERVKDLGDKGKRLSETDLSALARAVLGQTAPDEKMVTLQDFSVMTGVRVVPTASVRVVIGDKSFVASETGVGPVDSAMKAIQKATDSFGEIRLKEYRLEAITGGSDALAEVRIKVEDANGITSSASSAGEDIVVASVEAMLDGINKVLLKRRKMAHQVQS
ncbi:MAG: 2-isopropylmalate synthase [Thaumarchaeota archaeon]|nr:2-isopropylmalate synthase [Nitrososphaerota archaeon]MCL5316883.1 2-isopropylmalate synthase [Nitrososphaerota archaeon]